MEEKERLGSLANQTIKSELNQNDHSSTADHLRDLA